MITVTPITSDEQWHGLRNPNVGASEVSALFRRNWYEGDELRPPLWVAVQAITEAHLTGAKWCACAAIVVEFGIHLHVIDVPIHPGIIQRVRDETAKFWNLIDNGKMPEPDF